MAVKQIFDTIASLGKVVLKSRRPSKPVRPRRGGTMLILANGPSLRTAIEQHLEKILSMDRLCVNFAANAPDFFTLRPQFYLLADPHFFDGIDSDPNVKRLWENLAAVDWEMMLYIPVTAKLPKTFSNKHITVGRFNMTPLEGHPAIIHPLIDAGLGMPRPRNVLIPSIMTSIREGYDKILLAGADHSWLQSLWVDDENNVVSVQPHFYDDNEKEKERVRSEYRGYHLHDILNSMVIAFRSYWQIADYARRRGVEIINVTPQSYIDAFKRGKL